MFYEPLQAAERLRMSDTRTFYPETIVECSHILAVRKQCFKHELSVDCLWKRCRQVGGRLDKEGRQEPGGHWTRKCS